MEKEMEPREGVERILAGMRKRQEDVQRLLREPPKKKDAIAARPLSAAEAREQLEAARKEWDEKMEAIRKSQAVNERKLRELLDASEG
jgi:hypothetical protein